MSGKLSTPVNGTYSATKFAVEALSDALRLELAPFGVHVVLIEPGSIKTHQLASQETAAFRRAEEWENGGTNGVRAGDGSR